MAKSILDQSKPYNAFAMPLAEAKMVACHLCESDDEQWKYVWAEHPMIEGMGCIKVYDAEFVFVGYL